MFTRHFIIFSIRRLDSIRFFSTEMISSRDEISFQQKRKNTKIHFTIDSDDFIRGRVSSTDEISRVNTLEEHLQRQISKTTSEAKHIITGIA